MISNFKLFENVERAKKLLNTLEIDPQKSEAYSKIREMLKNADGYVYWFCKLHFVDKVPLEELSEVFDIIKNNKPIIQKFPKNIVDLENIEEFWDNWNKTINDLKVRKIINELPSTQKSFVSYEKDFDKLLELANNKNKQYFLKKVSRYKNRDQFFSALELFLSNKMDEGYDKIISFLKEKKIPIFYQDKENDIIITVVNYWQILEVGKDTSWCIVSSESTFNSYNSALFSRQFVIFLTDETGNLSKIGVTTDITGIRAAHFKNDANARDQIKQILSERGVDYKLLTPSKENILKANISGLDKSSLLDMISKEEILDKDNNIKTIRELIALDITKEDIKKWNLNINLNPSEIIHLGKEKCEELGIDYSDINFDAFEIRSLLKFGFTDDEIFDRKKIFNEYDYTSVTKEKFLKYNLIDKLSRTDTLNFVDKSIDLNTILTLLIERKPDKLRIINLVYERVTNKEAEIDKKTIELLSKIDWEDYLKSKSKAILFTIRKRRPLIIQNLNKSPRNFRYDFDNELYRFGYLDSDEKKEIQKLLIKIHKINFSEVNALNLCLFLEENISTVTSLVGSDEGFEIDYKDFFDAFSGYSYNFKFIYESIVGLHGKFIDTIGAALLDIFKKLLMNNSIYINLNLNKFKDLWNKLSEDQKNEVRQDFNYSRLSTEQRDDLTGYFQYFLEQNLVDKKNLNYFFDFFRYNYSRNYLNLIPKEIIEIIPDTKEYLDKLNFVAGNERRNELYEFCIKNDILLNTIKKEIKEKIKDKSGDDEYARFYDLLKGVETDLKELEDYGEITKYNLILNSIDKKTSGRRFLTLDDISRMDEFWDQNKEYILSKKIKQKIIEDGRLGNLILLLSYIERWEDLPSDLVILHFNINTNYDDKGYMDYIYNYLVKNLAKNINKGDVYDKISPDMDKKTHLIVDSIIRNKEFHISWILRFLIDYYPDSNLINIILDWVKGLKNNRIGWSYSKDKVTFRNSRLYSIKDVFEVLSGRKDYKKIIQILNYINPTKLERKDVFEYMWGMDQEGRNYFINGDYKNEVVKESRIVSFQDFITRVK